MSFRKKVAGLDREFKLDIRAVKDLENYLGRSMLSIANEGAPRFHDLCAVLFFARTKKDPVDFDVWCEAIRNEGYTNYLEFMAELMMDFFRPAEALMAIQSE